MHEDYKLEADAAFFLARPMLSKVGLMARQWPAFSLPACHSLCKHNYHHRHPHHPPHLPTPRILQKIASSLAKIDAKARTGKAYAEVTEAVLADVRKQIQVFHPAKVWSIITPELYTTFWTLSLYDLEVPRDAYAATTKRAKDAVVRCVFGACPFVIR